MLYTTCVTLCSEFEWPIPARYQHASEDVILTVLYRDIVSKMGVFTSLDTSMRVFDLEEFHWEQSSKVISPRDGEVFIRFIVRATASISGVPLASKTDHHALNDKHHHDVQRRKPQCTKDSDIGAFVCDDHNQGRYDIESGDSNNQHKDYKHDAAFNF